MPILRCYVDDVTMEILERLSITRGRGETPEQLAENAIADAAAQEVPPPIRGEVRAKQAAGTHRSFGTNFPRR